MRERTKVYLAWLVVFATVVGFAIALTSHLHGWTGWLPLAPELAAIMALRFLLLRAEKAVE